MKNILLLSILLSIVACEQDEIFDEANYQCLPLPASTMNEEKSSSLNMLLEDITSDGVPGIMLTVVDKKNHSIYWSGAKGYADLASSVPLYPCNITRVGSTVKTFTAVALLLLQEEGKLDLDDPVSEYLTEKQLDGLENATSATVRQLLQHSSGIYNYIQHLGFQTASLNDLIKVWTPEDLLSYARGEDAYFAPGTDVLYSNTNYILLGMIIESIEGKPFYDVFEEKIFAPLNLNNTKFAAKDPVPQNIIRGYVNLYSNLNLINATYYSGWDYYTADGGLISNSYDLARFMAALFEGELLQPGSLEEMLSWQAPNEQPDEGFSTSYGLGIFKIETSYGPAFIHSGDAIGYFASMVYFPEDSVVISWAVNANYGKIDDFTQSKEAMERIFKVALE